MDKQFRVSGEPKDMLSKFTEYIVTHEDWLMGRILKYAQSRGYAKYTSTLLEAWRLSISGLSNSLIEVVQSRGNDLEMSPDDDFTKDPASQFGIMEAEKHRGRGIRLDMFLGLMKYYRQSYVDLINESELRNSEKQQFSNIIQRFFDRVEIGFCSTWVPYDKEPMVEELQAQNRQMANEKNKYLTIFESLSIPAFIVNENEKIENMNYAASKLLNGNAVSGKTYYNRNEDVYLTKELPWVKDIYENFVQESQDNLLVETACEEQERFFSVALSRSLDVSGKFMETIILLEDITDEKKLIEQRQRSAQLAGLGTLAAGVAHEINNPIQGIMNYAQLIKNRPEEKNRVSDLAEKVIMESDRVSMITRSLLSYSKDSRNEMKSVALDETIKRALSLIGTLTKQQGINIELNVDSNVGDVFVQPQSIQQVIVNLVDNSAAALSMKELSPENKTISIDVTRQNEEATSFIQIEVHDNGIGMSPEVIRKAQDAFFTTRESMHGTGLGLSIVRDIVLNHNGEMDIDSQEGLYTNVIIVFSVSSSR